ncbi:ribosomal protein S18-alanine N-acetyltransferase [Thiohalomonas denitrificans]|uniref:[Ribosomal protein bS18]-alanine N-acetyltransferase n=1 Tax=Thiohalomonas denitrificans TaxID=415747 RepID=A0A1G5QN14_9GAMM|nr:ribosomal protein S18-alanine N-acetyltransferase [Thiohalomonas denitrificans]SCZ62950.1 ribosomal-protein-alanine N-acetyltransferase [Thiohalomonas denitrificans]
MSAAPDSLPRLRPMFDADVVKVMEVEREIYPFGWTEAIFRDCLRVGYSCWVWECGEEIIGYSVMSLGAGEAHVLNVAVHPKWRRRGLGRSMLEHLITVAERNRVGTIFLEVRPSNRTAMKLYEELQFQEIGRRRDYYPDHEGREDALVLSREL